MVSNDSLGASDSSTNVTWHANADGPYSVRVGGTSCSTGFAVASGGYDIAPRQVTTTVSADDLTEGANDIRVCVADVFGNQAATTASVMKDTTGPTVAIDSVSDTLIGPSDPNTDVTWHADQDGPYSVRVGGTSCVTGTEVAGGSYGGAPAQHTTTVSASDLAEGTNTIRVCVADTAGNQGEQSTSVVKDTTQSTTLTFGPEADARVEEANPSTNFGSSTTLFVEGGSALDRHSYLRFQLTGLVGTVEQAKLRLWVTNGTADGPAAYETDWVGAENAITWSNRPAPASGPTDDKQAIGSGAWVEYDVTPLVSGNGTKSFVLIGTSSDSLGVSSRESSTASHRPELVVTAVTHGSDLEPPSVPTGLTATASSPTSVDLDWTAATDNVAVTGYRIYRDGSLLTTVEDVTSYADTTVLASTEYDYEVRALDAVGNVSDPSNEATVTTPAPGPDPVIMAAGDQACDPTYSSFNNGLGTPTSCHQKYTSDLVVNQGLAAVLVLGDNQYECGGYDAFLGSYDPTWGRVKSITYPVPGNHEYHTTGGLDCDATGTAAGYFRYFGTAAGDPTKGYYSFNLGTWHLIALNSNCAIVSCSASSAQANWLRADLAANPRACTLAFWHHPKFTSGTNSPGSSSVKPLYQALYDEKADLVLVGHDHDYERFALKDPEGALDPSRGIRQIVVGTGGRSFHNWGTIQPGSEARSNDTFGVLKLTLQPTSYDWRFVPEAGKTYTDSGSTPCTV
jgi:Fibronectin type III domain/Calcineurin-like phosphoesterase